MTQTVWICVTIIIAIVAVVSATCLAFMAMRAYSKDAPPGAPDAFTAFTLQVLRMATVLAIVGTTLTLTLRNIELSPAVTGILSGIAGYVLGGTEKTRRLRQGKEQRLDATRASSQAFDQLSR